jgi:hypothetical protein
LYLLLVHPSTGLSWFFTHGLFAGDNAKSSPYLGLSFLLCEMGMYERLLQDSSSPSMVVVETTSQEENFASSPPFFRRRN